MSAITTDTFPAQCTVCQGPITDNRPKKASSEYKESYPDWKCQNQSCMTNGYRTGGYVKTDTNAGAQSTQAAQEQQAQPLNKWEEMELRASRCMHIAIKVTETLEKGYYRTYPDPFQNIFSTLYIDASRSQFPVTGQGG